MARARDVIDLKDHTPLQQACLLLGKQTCNFRKVKKAHRGRSASQSRLFTLRCQLVFFSSRQHVVAVHRKSLIYGVLGA